MLPDLVSEWIVGAARVDALKWEGPLTYCTLQSELTHQSCVETFSKHTQRTIDFAIEADDRGIRYEEEDTRIRS